MNDTEYQDILSRYTLEELEGVEKRIDKISFPERYEMVLKEIEKRKSGVGPREVPVESNVKNEEDDEKYIDVKGTPIPLYILGSLYCLWGGWEIYRAFVSGSIPIIALVLIAVLLFLGVGLIKLNRKVLVAAKGFVVIQFMLFLVFILLSVGGGTTNLTLSLYGVGEVNLTNAPYLFYGTLILIPIIQWFVLSNQWVKAYFIKLEKS